MGTPKTKGELLKSHASELVKQRIEYDVNDRVIKVFTAYTSAKNNDPCEVTEYIYRDGSSSPPASATSTQVEFRKEGYSQWNSAWDADFTVSEN